MVLTDIVNSPCTSEESFTNTPTRPPTTPITTPTQTTSQINSPHSNNTSPITAIVLNAPTKIPVTMCKVKLENDPSSCVQTADNFRENSLHLGPFISANRTQDSLPTKAKTHFATPSGPHQTFRPPHERQANSKWTMNPIYENSPEDEFIFRTIKTECESVQRKIYISQNCINRGDETSIIRKCLASSINVNINDSPKIHSKSSFGVRTKCSNISSTLPGSPVVRRFARLQRSQTAPAEVVMSPATKQPPSPYNSPRLQRTHKSSPKIGHKVGLASDRMNSSVIVRKSSPLIMRKTSPSIMRKTSPLIIRKTSPLLIRKDSPPCLRKECSFIQFARCNSRSSPKIIKGPLIPVDRPSSRCSSSLGMSISPCSSAGSTPRLLRASRRLKEVLSPDPCLSPSLSHSLQHWRASVSPVQTPMSSPVPLSVLEACCGSLKRLVEKEWMKSQLLLRQIQINIISYILNGVCC